MNFKAKMQKGAALQPLPPPMRHMCARRGQLGTAKRGNIFHIYFPAMHTHTFTCIFIYKHARAFAVSKQRHERERGTCVCVWGKRHKSSAACKRGRRSSRKTLQEYRGNKIMLLLLPTSTAKCCAKMQSSISHVENNSKNIMGSRGEPKYNRGSTCHTLQTQCTCGYVLRGQGETERAGEGDSCMCRGQVWSGNTKWKQLAMHLDRHTVRATETDGRREREREQNKWHRIIEKKAEKWSDRGSGRGRKGARRIARIDCLPFEAKK